MERKNMNQDDFDFEARNKAIRKALDELTDEEFGRLVGEVYNEYYDKLDDNDFEINRPQWMKMLRVLGYFFNLAKKSNGAVEPCDVQPKAQHGGVTAYFTVMDLKAEDIPQFCEMLQNTSAITIDATDDGRICISVSIPHVFVKKK